MNQTWQDIIGNPALQYAIIGAVILLVAVVLIKLLSILFFARPDGTQIALERMDDTQRELAGALKQLSESQMQSHNHIVDYVEKRFDSAQTRLDQSLGQTGARTAQNLGALMQRLEAIDKAQTKIEKLSGDVLGLQDILSNKQTRGNFGEIQLYDIVASALPADAFKTQATLSNGTRADCLVLMPNPPGPIAIDSKFPLEAYEALRSANSDVEMKAAQTFFKTTMRKHIRDIADKYIIEGETAEGAIMFLPSESVYAELHSNFPEIVREGFASKVWIVSPTTCMATLTTMRAVMKDMRMREQANLIRKELGTLVKDITRLGDRVGQLDRHFTQASSDVEAIKVSTQKVAVRSTRLETLEFDEGLDLDVLSKPTKPSIL